MHKLGTINILRQYIGLVAMIMPIIVLITRHLCTNNIMEFLGRLNPNAYTRLDITNNTVQYYIEINILAIYSYNLLYTNAYYIL